MWSVCTLEAPARVVPMYFMNALSFDFWKTPSLGSLQGSYGVRVNPRFSSHTSHGLLNISTNETSLLPPPLQSRGQMYPSLKRVRLRNRQLMGREV